ncbi:1-deoxy-D-xylulose-5-phosphate reductoisomerase [Helicobacter sp. 12S02232-10]|uniref:1-deoxy-D-xylulose-5-phosphate reductoisomerase n=1 Tax=Helicobacter sp. 12S02232-10 TaxID=1476197 RepID=UPI000BA71A5A|nr:1-deoxy-D-xylulose-5-phosphate reductoisomerase [Helicobacter sp. 12S02232-10]PAF49878.1 1-deoxy-D-xylulose-5-phosphate reductoisomerase [Helicobacter sp. 12S02232-10]
MILLGSTGTIGVNALKVAQKFEIAIEGISAGRNIDLFNDQIKLYSPKKVAIMDSQDLPKLNSRGAKVYVGEEGISQMIEESESSLVLNALVGFAGLKPTFCSLKYGKKLALANKESLVSAGWLIDTSKIVPIDSEHFGLWYLQNNKPFKKLVITASGGAFRDTPYQDIPSKNAQEALNHPNWKMGKKITIDSASMVNKLFEVLEAKWLFKTDAIEGYIERTSNIHALIEFVDGSTTAHFAIPDMKLPIAYALDLHKASTINIIPNIELEKLQNIKFEPIDTKKFPLWNLKDTLVKNPRLGVILNASNEVAVKKFLESKIPFGGIRILIEKSLKKFDSDLLYLKTQEDILMLDKEVRIFANSIL